jgi:hypothetical protein
MIFRRAAGALLAVASTLAALNGGAALADPPAAAPPPAASAAPPAAPPSAAPVAPPSAAPAAPPSAAASAAPAVAPPVTGPHGAIVVALDNASSAAARPLAQEVYRDPDLRPAIDEATARALTGSPPAADAPAKLKEIAELRDSISRTQMPVVARGLLASLGATLGAQLVIAVSMEAGRPVAKVLKAPAVTFERVELGATIETSADGVPTFRWPGAAVTLKGLLTAPAPAKAKEPDAAAEASTKKKAPPKDDRPFWKSPWFWGPVGGLLATGLTVFIASRVTSKPNEVHLEGQVAP